MWWVDVEGPYISDHKNHPSAEDQGLSRSEAQARFSVLVLGQQYHETPGGKLAKNPVAVEKLFLGNFNREIRS